MTFTEILQKLFSLEKTKSCVCDHPLPGCQKNRIIPGEEEE
jgi:hypothetical protein